MASIDKLCLSDSRAGAPAGCRNDEPVLPGSSAARGYAPQVVNGDNSTSRRSGLALVVLALLAEEPMHPYRMHRLIQQRGKDTVVNVARRNSINQTVERLRRDDQIEVQETQRAGNRPERTVYRITDTGRATLLRWMSEIISTPVREFPEMPAALSFVALFPPEEVLRWMDHRVTELERRLGAGGTAVPGLPRVFVIEEEYKRAMMEAELAWVRSIADELRTGNLTWSPDALRSFTPPWQS